jgi:hypothetical protein
MKAMRFGARFSIWLRGICCVLSVVAAPAAEYRFDAACLTPADGVYATAPTSTTAYVTGVLFRHLRLSHFTECCDLPVAGDTHVCEGGARASLELSTDDGASFLPAEAFVLFTHSTTHAGGGAGGQAYNTEMLQLRLYGGTLPNGLMIRESPTLPSLGRASARPIPGGHMVDSFFDVFTEISVDGGQTWTPAEFLTRMELAVDPSSLPAIQTPTPLVPPLCDAYASCPTEAVALGPNVTIRDLRCVLFAGAADPPDPDAPPVTVSCDATADVQVSMDGGMTFSSFRGQGTLVMRTAHRTGTGDIRTFDTEMLSLTLSGGLLPPQVMIRESPTLPSRGGTAIRRLPSGEFLVSSFFDVFTELSTDGGQSWFPAPVPLRLSLESPAEAAPADAANLLSPPVVFDVGRGDPLQYLGGQMMIRHVVWSNFVGSAPLPASGSSTVVTFQTVAHLDLSADGGLTFRPPDNAPAVVTVLMASGTETNGTRYFNTELLQMNVAGGSLPAGVMIRESPTRASLGRTSLRQGAGGARIDSFFDVFTELSLDGGQSWMPQASPPGQLERSRPDDPNRIETGIDLWMTPDNGGTYVDFAEVPIPAGFFGPGSDPFTGVVELRGEPTGILALGPTDHIVQRHGPAVVPPGGSDSVPIEIVALSLVSVQPIGVTFGGGKPEPWDVRICLSASNRQERGCMVIARDPCGDGGTFESQLPVLAKFTFTPSGGGDGLDLEPDSPALFTSRSGHWASQPPPGVSLVRVSGGVLTDHDCNGSTAPRGPLPGCTTGFIAGVRSDRPLRTSCVDERLLRKRLVTQAANSAAHAILTAENGVSDIDQDGIVDDADNAPTLPNPGQEDRDDDGVGDPADNWPDAYNPDQAPAETEVDNFPNSLSRLRLALPGGGTETVLMSGPTTVHVGIPLEGTARDTNGNGLEDVPAEMTSMQLEGLSSFGPVRVTLSRSAPTLGRIEELSNNTIGVLDVRPFASGGLADSFFDVFFEIQIAGQTLYPAEFITMGATITNKPPALGEAYTNRTGGPCGPLVVPDNGQGTATLPPAGARYASSNDLFHIIDGLPQGTTIDIAGIHRNFNCPTSGAGVCSFAYPDPGVICYQAGGSLTGEQQCADSVLEFTMQGTGSLTGFSRLISIPVGFETHTAPRTPGDPVQSFDTDMFRFFGQITGDPDFDLLRIVGGTDFGLPSPGHTTLTKQPSGNWAVDSFFDITYRIDFVGHPGGALGGMSGSTTGTIRMQAGSDCPPGGGVELLDAEGRPTGIRLVDERHTPNPEMEVDDFPTTYASITLNLPTGGSETVNVSGPSRVHVWIGPQGQAEDSDGDGLDNVLSEMVAMTLTGMSPTLGPVTVRLRSPAQSPFRRSLGGIEELVNSTPGILDVPPFAATGAADSFFDVFFEIEAGGMVLHNETPKYMASKITHKPPGPGSTYEDPTPIELYDENNTPTGIIVGDTRHTPDPQVETDVFPYSLARIELALPGGGSETVQLSGPTTVKVNFAQEGMADDSDGDGLDDVDSEMTQLQLEGLSSMGPVRVRLHPAPPTLGRIEELSNNTIGVLDVQPFAPTGRADSFFDVFFEIELAGQTLYPAEFITMGSTITHKPPAVNETYTNRTGVPCGPLVVPDNGQGTATLPPIGARYTNSEEYFHIIDGLPAGTTIDIAGIHRNFNCPTSGAGVCSFAYPDPGVICYQAGGSLTGEQQCADSVLEFTMQGTGSLTGFSRFVSIPVGFETHTAPRTPGEPVQSFDTEMFRLFGQVTGDPDFDLLRIVGGTDFGLPSPGHTTLTRQPGGDWAVDSFFDITYRIDFVGHPGGPLSGMSGSTTGTIRMQAGSDCEPNGGVELFTAEGQPTGIRLIRERHTPNPEVEVDDFPTTFATIVLNLPAGGSETVNLSGPSRVHVWIGAAGQSEDTDGDGRDQALSEMVAMNLTGVSPTFGPVTVRLRDPTEHPFRRSLGEIEELANNTPGILDVPPFAATGMAESFFDVFFEIEVGGMVLHNETPKHMTSKIDHKPPGPGTTFDDPTEIPLLDENNNPTGITVGGTRNTPVPEVETDYFPYALARILLRHPDGFVEPVTLAGPTMVNVNFAEEGKASDTDGDGRDQVQAEMTAMNLLGSSSMGPVRATLSPTQRTFGEIEELANNTPGTLDLSPFAPTGLADSFFDVFFELNVAGQPLYPAEFITMGATITHKPPAPGETYTNRTGGPCGSLVVPDNGSGTATLPPAGANYASSNEYFHIIDGLPAGTTIDIAGVHKDFLCSTSGVGVCSFPVPVTGVCYQAGGSLAGEQQCSESLLEFTMQGTGSLTGFSRFISIPVGCETHSAPRTGGEPVQSFDTDMFRFFGQIIGDPDFDLLRVVAGSDFGLPSPGHTTLTQQPGGNWAVDSFFDITYRIDFVGHPGGSLSGMSGSTTGTIRMHAGSDCPPGGGVDLLDAQGQPTGIRLVGERQTPNPEIEIDSFVHSLVLFRLALPGGSVEPVILSGPMTVHVRIPPDGMAADTDGDGLDQSPSEVVAMTLTGTSSLGPVLATLDPTRPSLGQFEERANAMPGRLDVRPFAPTGAADSFFDIFYEIQIAGETLHPAPPMHVAGIVTHKPSAPGELLANPSPSPVDLVDSNEVPSGLRGAWELTMLQPTDDCGSLMVAQAPDRTLRVWWPAPSDCLLEWNTNLVETGIWQVLGSPYDATGTWHVFTLPASNAVQFLRLHGYRPGP